MKDPLDAALDAWEAIGAAHGVTPAPLDVDAHIAAGDSDELYRWWRTLGATDQFIAFLNEKSNADALAATPAPLDVDALRRAVILMCNETINPEPDVLERIQRIGYAAIAKGDES
jgi:hypothetical protein